MRVFDATIKQALNDRLGQLEAHFDADVVFYYGEIHPFMAKPFRDFVEPLRQSTQPKNRLVMLVNTPGGSAEAVEKVVEIIRFHYAEVYFVIPDLAMSAGTINSACQVTVSTWTIHPPLDRLILRYSTEKTGSPHSDIWTRSSSFSTKHEQIR